MGFLPKGTRIIGYARSKLGLNDFRERIASYIKTPTDEAKKLLAEFKTLCSYVSGPYDKVEGYQRLDAAITEVERFALGSKNRVFYMALPPSVFVPVARGVKLTAFSWSGFIRLIVEKPFGHDLESSRQLHLALAPLWKEDEVIYSLFAIHHDTH
jgi:glucose-6-phosphate 1-dehydrogenase